MRSALSLDKAKLALVARSSKSSKREIKTTLNACTPNTTGLFLKSNLEYLRQNYRKAIQLDPECPGAYANLAVVYDRSSDVVQAVEMLMRAGELYTRGAHASSGAWARSTACAFLGLDQEDRKDRTENTETSDRGRNRNQLERPDCGRILSLPGKDADAGRGSQERAEHG